MEKRDPMDIAASLVTAMLEHNKLDIFPRQPKRQETIDIVTETLETVYKAILRIQKENSAN